MAARSDNFNRSDSYPSGLGNSSGDGTSWTEWIGSWGVTSNQAQCSDIEDAVATLECAEADGEVKVAVFSVTNGGLIFRLSDASNYCRVRITTTAISLRTFIAGVESSDIGSPYAYSYEFGDVISVIMNGSSVSVNLNDVEVIPPQTITHNATATQHGLYGYLDTFIRFDDFQFIPETPSGLTPGSVSFVFSGVDGIEMEATDATEGTAPYSYQWQRNEDGGSYSDLSGETTLSLTDDTAIEGVYYGYRLVYTDDETDVVTSGAVFVQVYLGGSFGSGPTYFAG